MPENYISKVKLPGDETAYDIRAHRTAGIFYGQVDSTSTSTKFTATIDDLNIDAYYDGLTILLYNGKVTSASGFTININGLGAKPSYSNMTLGNPVTPTDPTRDTTIFNINYAMLFVYNSTRVSGGCWICYRGYDANTNTIGYQLRTNSYVLNTADAFRYYKILFTSADGTHWVPAASATDNSATSKKTVNQRPINPFGEIVYCGSTTKYDANAAVSATTIWQQYTVTLGYSFNRTGSALTLTTKYPVYVKCAPQSNGSAIIDADTPYVQALPSEEDGKIYILLGMAYSATAIELLMNHPVYYYKDGAVRLWTNAPPAEAVSIGTLDTTHTESLTPSASESFSNNIDLHKVSKTGSYNDLSDKPTIPVVPTYTDGSATIATVASDVVTLKAGVTQNNVTIGNSSDSDITLAKVAKTGNYNDLSNKPTIPTGTVTSVAIAAANGSGITVDSGSPITSNGTITLGTNGLEKTSNKVTNLSSSSTDTEYPSAKVVYDELSTKIPKASMSIFEDATTTPHTFTITSPATEEEQLELLSSAWEGEIELYVTVSDMDVDRTYKYSTQFAYFFLKVLVFIDLLPQGIDINDKTYNGTFRMLGILFSSAATHAITVAYLNPSHNFNEISSVGYSGDFSDLTNKPSYTASGLSSSKTITTLSQSDGVISATASNIAITSDQVTKYATDVTIATNDKLGIFDASDSNKLKGSSISFDTTETGTYLRRDGTWATPPSGGNRVVYTAYFSNGEVGYASGIVTLDDSKTGADIIANIESGNQVVIQIEDIESDIYEFTYSGARDNSTYIFTYVSNSDTNFQVALIVTTVNVVLKQGAYMELISNKVSSITPTSSNSSYPNVGAVYDAISGGAYSHYKLSTMDIAVSANYQTITINDIVGGFDCAVGDIVIGRNGNYGHIVSWSTSANPHSGTILYDGYLDDQIWSRSDTGHGIWYPNSLNISNVYDGAMVVAHSTFSGVPNAFVPQAGSTYIFASGTSTTLRATASAGATSYVLGTVTGLSLGDGDLEYLKEIYFWGEASTGAYKPTSITTSNDEVTINFSTSLNPTAELTSIHYGSTGAQRAAFMIGDGININQQTLANGLRIYSNGRNSFLIGQNLSNSGAGSMLIGARHHNTAQFSTLLGDKNSNAKQYAFLAGLGHNSSSGVDGVAAVGKYSSISSDTAFAVGIGTADNARANAFVVHTDGRATITTAPTANMDVANKSYVDDNITSHTHGNITNDGKIGTTANYAVYTTTGGALTASAALPTTITNATIAALPTWTAVPTDTTYLIRQDTGGSNSFGRVTFSTVNNYIKSKNPVLNYVTYDSTEDAIKFVFPS